MFFLQKMHVFSPFEARCFPPKLLVPKVKELLKRIASDTTGGVVEDEKPLMESGDSTPGLERVGDMRENLL